MKVVPFGFIEKFQAFTVRNLLAYKETFSRHISDYSNVYITDHLTKYTVKQACRDCPSNSIFPTTEN